MFFDNVCSHFPIFHVFCLIIQNQKQNILLISKEIMIDMRQQSLLSNSF